MYELEKCEYCKHKDRCKMKHTFSPLGCSSGFVKEEDDSSEKKEEKKEKII